MVTRSAEIADTKTADGAFAKIADRWIYVFMAGLFVVTALVGFIPNSIGLLESIAAGQRPPLPTAYHIHAVLMGSWLLLLLAQTSLMAVGNREHHMKLGLTSIVLVPLIVIAMLGIIDALWAWVGSIPEDAMPPAELSGFKVIVSDVLLAQLRIVILFPVLIAWAVYVRRSDPETHKRLMIVATVMPLPAAIDRMTWLPHTIPEDPTSMHLYTLLLLLPALIYDVVRKGTLHRAYVIGIALNLPFIIATHLLWSTPWWLAVAPTLVGVENW